MWLKFGGTSLFCLGCAGRPRQLTQHFKKSRQMVRDLSEGEFLGTRSTWLFLREESDIEYTTGAKQAVNKEVAPYTKPMNFSPYDLWVICVCHFPCVYTLIVMHRYYIIKESCTLSGSHPQIQQFVYHVLKYFCIIHVFKSWNWHDIMWMCWIICFYEVLSETVRYIPSP